MNAGCLVMYEVLAEEFFHRVGVPLLDAQGFYNLLLLIEQFDEGVRAAHIFHS